MKAIEGRQVLLSVAHCFIALETGSLTEQEADPARLTDLWGDFRIHLCRAFNAGGLQACGAMLGFYVSSRNLSSSLPTPSPESQPPFLID